MKIQVLRKERLDIRSGGHPYIDQISFLSRRRRKSITTRKESTLVVSRRSGDSSRFQSATSWEDNELIKRGTHLDDVLRNMFLEKPQYIPLLRYWINNLFGQHLDHGPASPQDEPGQQKWCFATPRLIPWHIQENGSVRLLVLTTYERERREMNTFRYSIPLVFPLRSPQRWRYLSIPLGHIYILSAHMS